MIPPRRVDRNGLYKTGVGVALEEETGRVIRMPSVADSLEKGTAVCEIIRRKDKNHDGGCKRSSEVFVEGYLIGQASTGPSAIV